MGLEENTSHSFSSAFFPMVSGCLPLHQTAPALVLVGVCCLPSAPIVVLLGRFSFAMETPLL